jgi:3-hydroxybutyryl-CoA dehydratase
MKIGDRASLSRKVTEADIDECAKLTQDRNPLHMDEVFANKHRFGKRIAHGILSLGLISAVLGNILPGPGTIILDMNLKFMAPVFINDIITAEVEVVGIKEEKGIITLKTECKNQNKTDLISGIIVVLFKE